MPLEPIAEEDLNLESKFGKVEPGKPFEIKETLPKLEENSAKEIISAEKDSAYNKILSKVQSQQTPSTADDDVKNDAKKVSEKQDADSQIQHLVDIASTKGVLHAVKVARHLEDDYVLDTFHDKLLADELHDALLKKGLIEEI
jgi:CMP-N-acetylneuraminic acid synthetase